MIATIQTINTIRIIEYIYAALCLIYIIYQTIDPKSKKPLSSFIGRFFVAVIKVALFSFLIGLLIGFVLPFFGLNYIQYTLFG